MRTCWRGAHATLSAFAGMVAMPAVVTRNSLTIRSFSPWSTCWYRVAIVSVTAPVHQSP
jgi:hypothetical protein